MSASVLIAEYKQRAKCAVFAGDCNGFLLQFMSNWSAGVKNEEFVTFKLGSYYLICTRIDMQTHFYNAQQRKTRQN